MNGMTCTCAWGGGVDGVAKSDEKSASSLKGKAEAFVYPFSRSRGVVS